MRLFYGDPGSGKTTLLRHLAWKLARTGGRERVPVFVTLPRIVRAGGWFLDALCDEHKLTSVAPAALRDALDALGREGRLLLLFDGLDEVPAELRGSADALLGESADRWPRAPIVVTSRPIGGHQPGPEFRELELLPFADAERHAFLTRWLGDEARAASALARLRRETTVWELAGNPLYLTLLAMLFEEKVEIPERRSVLYDRIFAHLLDGKHRREQRAIQRPVLVRSTLRHLATAMTEDDREAESVEALEERLWEAEDVKAKRAFAWERPQHEVTISSPFEMAVVPVTNAQYRAFDPTYEPHAWEDHPVVKVTWYAAVAFCRWLADRHPGVRLPTEEEWEYACRAGTTSRFWSGDEEADLDRVGWYSNNSKGRTHQVGEKPANPWGLHDMHGNVWEWTWSLGTYNYSEHRSGRTVDPSAVTAAPSADFADGATPGGGRVVRGGGYWDGASSARSASRLEVDPRSRNRDLGFRLVRPVRGPER